MSSEARQPIASTRRYSQHIALASMYSCVFLRYYSYHSQLLSVHYFNGYHEYYIGYHIHSIGYHSCRLP